MSDATDLLLREIGTLIVWQTIVESAPESLLALLFFEGQLPRMTIVFDHDDILVGSPEVLWRSLGSILSHVASVRTENLEPKSESRWPTG